MLECPRQKHLLHGQDLCLCHLVLGHSFHIYSRLIAYGWRRHVAEVAAEEKGSVMRTACV